MINRSGWLILAAHAVLIAWVGLRDSPSLDEVGHLPAGISHWQWGEFDLYKANPPLVRSLAAIPVVASGAKADWSKIRDADSARREYAVGTDFLRANGERSFWYFTVARWAVIPLSLVGAWTCYRWATELYGNVAGIVALVLWCYSPGILAYASQITPDCGAAALGVLAGYL